MNYNGKSDHGYNEVGPNDSYVEDEIDLLNLFNTLLLNKWTFVGFVSVFTILAAAYSLTLTPIYQSSGSMMISESKNRYSYAGSDLANLLTTSYGIGVGSTIANELQILKSRKLSNDLAVHIRDIGFDKNGNKFPILWRAYPVDSTTVSLDTVARRYRKQITFEQPNQDADIVSLAFSSPLPTEAATVVNLTMDTYSTLSTEQNRSMAVSALDFLNDERLRIEERLMSTEDSLQAFMNKTNLVSVEPQASELITTLSQLSVEKQKLKVNLVAVTSGIEQYEKQLEEIKPGLADQYSNAVGPVIERYQYALAELETERLLYITKNPNISPDNKNLIRLDKEIDKVKSQIKERSNRLISSGSDLYLSFMGSNDGSITQRISEISQKLLQLKIEQAQYKTQEEVLSARHDEINSRFENLPDEIIALSRLKRDVRINEEMYLQVSSQQAEMSLWEKTQFGLGRPLDYAVPADHPIKPKKRIITLIGFLLGGVFGVGFIFIKDLIQDTIKSTDALKAFGIPVLGTVPDFEIIGEFDPSERQLVGDKSVSNQLVTFFDHISPISETYRRLRINIVHTNPDKEYKVLMVSSPSKGEGKSTLAANLAVTFTLSDKKVLIIDLDLHRPAQQKVFGVDREPGLTDLLFDTSSLEEVLCSTVAPNVDLIPVGRKTPEPASVLDSRRLKQLIEDLSTKYDHIILDTAPYSIIADSASLIRLIDGIVLVSRFKKTQRREMEFTINGLKHLNADLVGIVLNAFNPKESSDYYTNYNYYQRAYSEYYKEES